MSANEVMARGFPYRDRVGGIVIYIMQLWEPDIEQIDWITELGWAPSWADLNAGLTNSVVFQTAHEDVALSVMTVDEWDEVRWLSGPGETDEPN